MFNKIKNILGKVWNGFVTLGGIYTKIAMLPWNLAFKLYHWVYDEI